MITTWKFQGLRFFALPIGGSVHVVDEAGRNYGAWSEAATFRKAQQAKEPHAAPLPGSVVEKFWVYITQSYTTLEEEQE